MSGPGFLPSCRTFLCPEGPRESWHSSERDMSDGLVPPRGRQTPCGNCKCVPAARRYGLGHGRELHKHYAVIPEPRGRMVFEQMGGWGDIQAGSGGQVGGGGLGGHAPVIKEPGTWALLRETTHSIHLPGSSQRTRQSLGNGLSP